MAKQTVKFTRRHLGDDGRQWARVRRLLRGIQVVDLATCDQDGPHVRPITTVEAGGALYALTGTSDAKVRQLRHDPRYEAHLPWKRGKHTGYVRFRGRVELVKDREEIEAAADAAGFLESYWTGIDDPNLTVLRLGIEAAEVMPPGKAEWIHLAIEGKQRSARRAPKGRRARKG